MNLKKIIVLATMLIIATITFVGCKKTTNDNTLNKEKAKVEDTQREDTQEDNKKNNKEDSKIEDGEVEKIGEKDTELDKDDSTQNKQVNLKNYDAVAKIDPLMFGANVTVTCKGPEIATYRIFSEIEGNMEPIQEDKVEIGKAAMVFPAEEGQSVLIKFYDSKGSLLGQSKTTLVL